MTFDSDESGFTVNSSTGEFSASRAGVFTIKVFRDAKYHFSTQIIVAQNPGAYIPPPIILPPPKPPPIDPPEPEDYCDHRRDIMPGVPTPERPPPPPPADGGHRRIQRPPNAPQKLPPMRPINSNPNRPTVVGGGWIDRKVWLSPSAYTNLYHPAAGVVRENDMEMRIARMIGQFLEFYGINYGIRSTRSIQEDQRKAGVGTDMSVRESNGFEADYYVSVGSNTGHASAYGRGPGPGISHGLMAYASPVDCEISECSWGLAEAIVIWTNIRVYCRTYAENPLPPGGLRGNGGRSDPDFGDSYKFVTNPHGHKETGTTVNAASIMVKHGFRDSPQDAPWIVNNAYRIAEAYAIGICLAIGFHPEPLL